MLVLINHREFTTESNKTKLSIIRFCMLFLNMARTRLDKGAYLITLLQEHLVVFAESHAEDD